MEITLNAFWKQRFRKKSISQNFFVLADVVFKSLNLIYILFAFNYFLPVPKTIIQLLVAFEGWNLFKLHGIFISFMNAT